MGDIAGELLWGYGVKDCRLRQKPKSLFIFNGNLLPNPVDAQLHTGRRHRHVLQILGDPRRGDFPLEGPESGGPLRHGIEQYDLALPGPHGDGPLLVFEVDLGADDRLPAFFDEAVNVIGHIACVVIVELGPVLLLE